MSEDFVTFSGSGLQVGILSQIREDNSDWECDISITAKLLKEGDKDAEDNMYSILISAVIIPLISYSMVLGGLLSISFLQLPTIRKNMRM